MTETVTFMIPPNAAKGVYPEAPDMESIEDAWVVSNTTGLQVNYITEVIPNGDATFVLIKDTADNSNTYIIDLHQNRATGGSTLSFYTQGANPKLPGMVVTLKYTPKGESHESLGR